MYTSPEGGPLRERGPGLPAIRMTVPAGLGMPRRPAAENGSAGGFNSHQALQAVRQWWKIALPSGLLLAAWAGGVAYALFHPVFEATAWLRIEERVPFIAFESKDSDQTKSFVQTQIELLRSPMVLQPVLTEPDFANLRDVQRAGNPVEWLAEAVKVKAVGTSELYLVSVVCSEPRPAAQLVNAIVDAYLRLRDQEQAQRQQKVIDLLAEERARRAKEVALLREKVRAIAKQVTGKDPFQASQDLPPAEARSLADLSNRLIAAEVEETVLTAKLQVVNDTDSLQRARVPESAIDKAVAENAQVVQSTAELLAKRSRLAERESKLAKGKDDPAYKSALKEVSQAEEALEQLKAALRGQIRQQSKDGMDDKRRTELAALQTDLENRRAIKELLKDRYEAELKSLKRSNGDTIDLRFRQDELARAEKVLDLISERAVKLQTEQGAPSRVWLMKTAEVPQFPVQQFPLRNVVLAALVGLCLPFAVAILVERMMRRVSDPDSLEQQAQCTVLGEITRLPTRRRSAAGPRRRERLAMQLYEESVDMLRTNLLLAVQSGPLRVLTVTSAVNNEGKTSAAVQLAVSIAKATREHTLLIDGDMRSPSVHQVFQVPQEPGLTRALTGECTVSDAIVPTWTENLDLLPAGELRDNPHSLVGNGRLETLLKRIPAKYRYVIIDAPPVLAASEALVLAKGSDAVLLCAMRDVSRVYQLRKALERVVLAGGKLAGMVLNGVPASLYASRYGGYYYPDRGSERS